MDPARNLIHLGLKLTETGLDRALGIVRLADTLLAASAVPTSSTEERRWPEEEQGDLEALSKTLMAKGDQPASTAAGEDAAAAPKKRPARKTSAKKASTTTGPAKKTTAKKSSAKRATAKKAPAARKTAAKKTTAPKKETTAPAKKSTAKKAATKKATDA